jgi:biotin carboxyl carrier protein
VKLRVETNGETYTLDLQNSGSASEYTLAGVHHASGSASIAEVMPGVFSVLLGTRSFTVRVVTRGDQLEVSTGTQRRFLSLSDTRDRSGAGKKNAAAGAMEVRAQMPGKVIKLLVELGSAVEAGQGLIVVEAMKMQNEMKAPKDGTISRIDAVEGATVAAGEPLLVVE